MPLLVTDTLTEPQIDQLTAMLVSSWWARRRSRDLVVQAVAGSDVVVGLCDADSGELLAFGRAISDRVVKALVLDVIVTPERRGEGIGSLLMTQLMDHSHLKNVRHVELYCQPEMIRFYRRWGFDDPKDGVILLRRPPD